MEWELAPDIQSRLKNILKSNIFPHIDADKIVAIRGFGSTSRAVARIWSLPRPWQMVLKTKPQYIIEVIAQKFDKLSEENKDQTLIHELLHIPKTFSGALSPHKRGFHRKVYDYYHSWRKHSRQP